MEGVLGMDVALLAGNLYSLCHDAVALVHDAIVLVHIPDVACYQSLELQGKHRQRLVAFLLCAWLELKALRLGKDTVCHSLRHMVVGKVVVEACVALLKLGTMLVYITQGGVDDERACHNLSVELCKLCGV